MLKNGSQESARSSTFLLMREALLPLKIPDQNKYITMKELPMILDPIVPSPLDYRDYRAKFTGVAPDFVDLKPDVVEVEDQQQYGSCTANAGCSALELMYHRGIHVKYDFSRMYVYFYSREAANIAGDAGAFPRDLCKILAKKGTCHESTWPYSAENISNRPSDAADQEAESFRIAKYEQVTFDIDQMKLSVANGVPILTTVKVHKTFMGLNSARDWRDTDEICSYWDPSGEITGYHEVLIIGYDEKQQVFLAQNSWGPSFGDGGFFGIPFGYVNDVISEMWVITSIFNVPIPIPDKQRAPIFLKKTLDKIKIGAIILAFAAVSAYQLIFHPMT